MDSPYLSSSSSSASRPRVDSTFSIHLADTGTIHKRNSLRPNRTRSISATTLERHPELLPERVQRQLHLGPPSISIYNWNNQRHSPRSQLLQTPFTPPVSNSQRSSQPGSTASGPSSQPVKSTDSKAASTPYSTHASPPVTSADMASLGYLPTPHFTNMAFHDPSYDPNYQQMDPHPDVQSSNNFNFLFGSSAPPSQLPIYTSGPLHMETAFSAAPSKPTMSTLNRASSPFQQPSFDNLDYTLSQSQNQIPISRSISHSPMSQHLGPLTPPLTSGLDAPSQLARSPPLQHSIETIRSPAMYETHGYSASYTAPPAQAPLYHTPQSYSYSPAQPSSARQQMRKLSSESHARVINQKPKPQCWEHGCNGREFSTFSNLLRHQREKSGTASKSYCPKCGAEFTRTTARNGHLAHEKCSKQRRSSENK